MSPKSVEEQLRDQMDRGDIEKAEHARQLLEDPLFLECWDALESELWRLWKGTAPPAAQDRERIYFQWTASRLLRKELTKLVDRGILSSSKQAAREAADGGNGLDTI